MMSRLNQLLQVLASDPRFGKVAGEAIDLVNNYGSPIELSSPGEPDSSKTFADLWALRQRNGYYDPNLVLGVEETIEALYEADCAVSLAAADLEGPGIAIWVDTAGHPVGLIVIKSSTTK